MKCILKVVSIKSQQVLITMTIIFIILLFFFCDSLIEP